MFLALMIISFIIFMIIGFPVAFAMLFSSTLYIIFSGTVDFIYVAQKMTSSLISFPLLAIPFFVLAGCLMNEVKVGDKIFNFANTLVGHVKGGLAHVNILASFIFAGMSGSSTADAGGLGLVEIEAMNKAKYPPAFSAGISAASSAIGPIVPPSVMLVLYGVASSTSVGKLFLGGIFPGVLMVISMMIQASIIAHKRNFPAKGSFNFKNILSVGKQGFFAILTPVLLLFSIFSGIVTPTELGVILNIYLLILGLLYKTINLKKIKRALVNSFYLISQILILVSSASVFGTILIRENVPQMLLNIISKLPFLNGTTFLLLLCLVLLILGMFIEGIAVLTMMTPIVIPMAKLMGIDFIQLGVVMVLAIEIGLITPPFGLCCFITADIAKVPVLDVFRESSKFLISLVIVLLILIFFPNSVLFLANLI